MQAPTWAFLRFCAHKHFTKATSKRPAAQPDALESMLVLLHVQHATDAFLSLACFRSPPDSNLPCTSVSGWWKIPSNVVAGEGLEAAELVTNQSEEEEVSCVTNSDFTVIVLGRGSGAAASPPRGIFLPWCPRLHQRPPGCTSDLGRFPNKRFVKRAMPNRCQEIKFLLAATIRFKRSFLWASSSIPRCLSTDAGHEAPRREQFYL